jgi:predicted MFS family arabinose efflux permease
VQATGALCLGMALLATARAPSPAVVDGVYGVLGGIGFAALAQVTAAATIQPWFSDRRGLAIGVANAGNSLGMLILGPLALFLIARWGWRATDWWFGVGVLALLLPLVGGVLRAPAGAAPAADRSERPPAWAALRHPLFLRLAIPYFVCGYTTNGLMGPHFVSFLDDDGFAVPVVAAAVGIMGGANILGTVAAGALSDRMPPGRLLALIYGVRGATLLALLATRADWLIVGLSGLYGLLDYATVPPTAALALAGFGRSLGNRGAALGYALVVMAHQLGAAVSSLVGGVLVDATGGYLAVFALAASLLVVAASVSAGIRALPTTVAGRA